MANYATLKAAIAAAIKQNGNNEITGNLLQQQLLAMVNSLGVGYQYAGVATPATNPGTPDQNVFYFASEPGTYSNFSGIVLGDNEVAILKWNGAWSKDSTGAAPQSVIRRINNLCKVGTAGHLLLYSDGSETNMYSNTFNCTGFIDVSDILYIRYSLNAGGTATAILCAYDENKNYIQENSIGVPVGYARQSGRWEKGPTTKYVRISFQVDVIENHLAFAESPFFESDVKTIAEQLIKTNRTTNIELDVNPLVQGLLNASTGNAEYRTGDYPNYRFCNTYFPIYGAKKIMTNARCTGSTAAICFYDENKNFLSSVSQSVTDLTEHDIPVDAYYARFSTERYNITNGILAFEINSNTYEKFLVEQLAESVERAYDITPLLSNKLLSATNGTVVSFSGAADKYKACETFFPITEGRILVTNARCTGSTAAICFYSGPSTSNFLSSVQITDAGINLLGHIVPAGAKYFRICTERYDVTNSLLAISFENNSNNEFIQFLLDALNTRVTNVESMVAASNPTAQYFDPNMDAWIAKESTKQYKPGQDVIQHKHAGNVTPKSRFLVWGFDDFRNTDFSLIIPLFNKYGARAEFNKIFLNTVPTQTEINQMGVLVRNRHELGDHTWLHYKYPFDEPLFNGQDPAAPDGTQTPYPTNADFRNDRGDGKNAFGIPLNWTVNGTNSYIPISTTWGQLSDAECQQIRNLFSVMKDTDTNLINILDELSNTYLGTTGASLGSWDNATQKYTGGIFTGCKTSANHEIWERYLRVTNMFLKDKFGLNYNMQTWSKPGSKTSGCYYEYNDKKYYDPQHTIFVNNLARFASSLFMNNDGTPLMRSWTDVLAAYGFTNTNDANDPGLVDGQIQPCMSIQFMLNSAKNKPNALIYPNTRHKFMDYIAIATEYTEGVSLQGTEPYEVQMYNDVNSSFHKAVEGWRKVTANGIIAGQITDSLDTWSERIIIEGLLKFAKFVGIKPITLSEAFDVCFNNSVESGNLLYNPEFRNSAKEFMPTANVPTNPDGFDGDCSVTKTGGVPVLITADTTIYDHYGVPCGLLIFTSSIKGVGTITVKEIKNNTPYNNIDSATIINTISVNDSNNFVDVTENIIVSENDLTAYEQRCAGYGERVIGLRFIISGGLSLKNMCLKKQ